MKSNSAFQSPSKVETHPTSQAALLFLHVCAPPARNRHRGLHGDSMQRADKTSYNKLSIYLWLTLSCALAEVDTTETCGLHSNACEGRLSGQLAH